MGGNLTGVNSPTSHQDQAAAARRDIVARYARKASGQGRPACCSVTADERENRRQRGGSGKVIYPDWGNALAAAHALAQVGDSLSSAYPCQRSTTHYHLRSETALHVDETAHDPTGRPGATATLSRCQHPGHPGPHTAKCQPYRYALTRVFDHDLPLACFIMLNPSTASAFEMDRTVAKCLRYAKRWGAGGMVVLNAFAWRATDPKLLPKLPDPVGSCNDQVIYQHLGTDVTPPHRINRDLVVAAWGNAGTLGGRDLRILELLDICGVKPLALNVTDAKQPQHPLYLPDSADPFPYQRPEDTP